MHIRQRAEKLEGLFDRIISCMSSSSWRGRARRARRESGKSHACAARCVEARGSQLKTAERALSCQAPRRRARSRRDPSSRKCCKHGDSSARRCASRSSVRRAWRRRRAGVASRAQPLRRPCTGRRGWADGRSAPSRRNALAQGLTSTEPRDGAARRRRSVTRSFRRSLGSCGTGVLVSCQEALAFPATNADR